MKYLDVIWQAGTDGLFAVRVTEPPCLVELERIQIQEAAKKKPGESRAWFGAACIRRGGGSSPPPPVTFHLKVQVHVLMLAISCTLGAN